MKTVTIIQRVLPHYRVPFVNLLRESLWARGIDLQLVYGQECPGTVPKTVDLDAPWALKIRNTYLKVPGIYELVWQPCIKYIKRSDLIIVEQANRLLVNYLLLSRFVARGSKIAFWGHGKNMQSANPNGMKETFKRLFIKKVDWWFAYTHISGEIVEGSGFSGTKMTVVNNSIDTDSLSAACKDVNDEVIYKVKKELGIKSENVGVFCGRMVSDKKLPFLIESCILTREMVQDFHMIFIGDGPLQHLVSDACAGHSWMHYIGPKFGNERVPYIKVAKAMLNPGLVGLVVIDSFLLGVPIITTNPHFHGPEIHYLEDNRNGIITAFIVKDYAAGIASYLQSPEKQTRIKKSCAESSCIYTLDNMVDNFVSGVTSCLSLSD